MGACCGKDKKGELNLIIYIREGCNDWRRHYYWREKY